MDTIFDKPRWTWHLAPPDASIIPRRGHDSTTAIVKPGDNEPEVLGTVLLLAPSDTAFFLEQQGVKHTAETYYLIVVKGKRAYVHLCVVDVEEEPDQPFSEYRLFYWTKSTAPVWMAKYLQ